MDENTNTPNETSEAMDFSFLDVEEEKPENEAVEAEAPEESNDNDTVDTSVEAEEEDTVDVPEEAPAITETTEDTATTTTEEKEDDSPYAFLTMAAEEKAKEEDEEKPITDAATVTEMLTNQAMENAAKGNEYAQSAKTDATKETKAEEESKKGTFSDTLQESIDAIKQSIDMIKESGKGSSKETLGANSFKDLIERNKETTNITETADKALKGEVPYSLPEPKAEEVRDIQIGEDGKIKSIEKSEPFTNKEDLKDMALTGDLHDRIEELQDFRAQLQEALKNAETDEEKNSIRSAMIGNDNAINYYQKAEKEAFEEEFDNDPAKAADKLRELTAELDEVRNKINAGDMSAENVNAQSSLIRTIDAYARATKELFPESTSKSETPTDSSKSAEEFITKSPDKEEEKPVTPPVEAPAPTTETPAPAPTPIEDAETKAPETVVTPKMDAETSEEMTQALESLNTDDKANIDKVIEVINNFDPTLATFLENAVNKDWNVSNIASGNAYKQRGMEYSQNIQEIWANEDRSFLGKIWDTVKETAKAGKDFKNITKNTQAYQLIKSAQALTARTIFTAIAAATGAPLAAVLIWGGSLAKGQMQKLVKNVTNDDFIADSYAEEEEAGAEETVESAKRNYDEGLIQKWDKNDVSIDNSGYNKGLKEQETARKELPSDAFVKIIYKKEPWIRKFHV